MADGMAERGTGRRSGPAPERDQGDGAATPDLLGERSRTTQRSDSKPFSIKTEVDTMQWLLFIIALATRMWRLEKPKAIVFDELHFGRFASMYLQRTFFFDTHPPLGKMMLAAAAWLQGYDGSFNFDNIGTVYSEEVPVWHMRVLPALCGSFLVPTVYQLVVELRCSRWTAALAGAIIILENSLLVQSKFMLMEGILLFVMTLAILSYLKFRKYAYAPMSGWWWFWLISLAVTMGACPSIKYVGVYTVILLVFCVGRDAWLMVADTAYSDRDLLKHLMIRLVMLAVVPLGLYISMFYVHLSILNKAGPHDDIMTSAFQASLEGGLAAITKGQPLEIAYGSQITLRHTYSKPCWLHSHAHVYPIRYPDGRGSSHQQQVTCYPFKDVNNWWIVKHPNVNQLTVDDPAKPVRDGDVVQLVHGMTTRALNSHDVAAPVTPINQEVTCYIDYNISIPTQNLWKVEIVNKKEAGNVWKTIQSHVRLHHVNTSQALTVTGKSLPDWGFHQLEVATDKVTNQESTVWNVEEHKYTRNPDEENRSKELLKSEMIPTEPTKLSFWTKFLELQIKMLLTKQDSAIEHRYSSEPLQWPFLDTTVAYWISPDSNAQIHLLGNPVIWLMATFCLVLYGALLLMYVLRRRRQCYDISQEQWRQYREIGEIFVLGYLLHFLPHLCYDSSMLFLHHYLPALLYKLILIPVLMDHIYHNTRLRALQRLLVAAVVVWFLLAFYAFLRLRVFMYGVWPMTEADVKSFLWNESWDFITHKP